MEQSITKPRIYTFETFKEFIDEFNIGKEDLIIINYNTFNLNFKNYKFGANIILLGKYDEDEISDEIVKAMYNDIKNIQYNRVIAIGGENVLNVSKLFALKIILPIVDLFNHKLEIIKDKELILISTTCETDNELTNTSTIKLKKNNEKLRLTVDALYADYTVIITELLEELPFKYFATCSIDALIHAIESNLSSKSTSYSEMFCYKAIEIILNGYKEIVENGPKARIPLLKDFLLASNFVEIALDITKVGVVHAMSQPLERKYNIPHGESNFLIFIGLFKTYQDLNPNDKITQLNKYLSRILDCREDEVYIKMEKLLSEIIPKKHLKGYYISESELVEFAKSAITAQEHLMINSHFHLTEETIYNIYKSLY